MTGVIFPSTQRLVVWAFIGVLMLAALVLQFAGAPHAFAEGPADEEARESPLWTADMLVVEYTSVSIGAATADLFSNVGGSAGLHVKWLWSYIPDRDLRLAFEEAVPDAADLTLQVGDLMLAFPAESSGDNTFIWKDVDVDWEDGQTLAVRIGSNTRATGAPSISGTVRVGETLTAVTTGITDADGLDNATFSYKWMSNDGNTDSEIQDATDSTYTLVPAEVGKTIRVRVSFFDRNGFAESLTSPATGAVAPPINTRATGAPTISGTIRVGETLTASTSDIQDANGLDGVTLSYQWLSVHETTETEIEGATDATYTLLLAEEGKTIRVRVSFTDRHGFAESLPSPATGAVAPPIDTPATGAPTISGSILVGETLTASTSNIRDANGLDGVSFSYQWISVYENTETEIQGATDASYILTAADLGMAFMVRVSFTDRHGFAESLTSPATGEVKTVPSAPRNVTFTQSDAEELVVSWEEPVSDGGSAISQYVVQWRSASQSFSPLRQGTTYGTTLNYTITGLEYDVSYFVVVHAITAVGHSRPSVAIPVTLTSNETTLRRFIQQEVVEEYQSSRPWLRDTWQYMNQPGFEFEVRVLPPDTSLGYAARVNFECSISSDSPLPRCEVTWMQFVYEYIASQLVATHEMAHIYTLTNDIAANPAPLALAHLYLISLDLDGLRCRPVEMYADLVTLDLVLLSDGPFDESISRLPYWSRCNSDYVPNSQPPLDSLTEEALTVVRSAMTGQMPQWFSDTYDDAHGNPDLERFWTDVNAIEHAGERDLVVYQLRDAFGGYCDEQQVARAVESQSVAVRNPWRDGGCVPDAPGDLIATAGDAELALSWEPPDSDGGTQIQAHRVEWKIGSGDYDASRQEIVTDVGNRLSHTITGLTNGIDYTVRVLVFNFMGEGAYSAEVRATPRDTNSPELVAAEVVGGTLTLRYNETLDGGSAPSPSVFEVTFGGAAVAVTDVSIQGSTVTLTLASAVMSSDEVTLGYSVPVESNASRIQDAAGNGALSFSGSVTNHTPAAGNREATGAPTIDGAVQVGETLIASVSDIGDADGLAGVTFSYQWVSNDGASDSYILGATDSAYALAAADAGKTLKVRVTFTDQGGTLETLTSAATDTVIAAALTSGGICGRTEQVRAAILEKLSFSECKAVTEWDLRDLRGTLSLQSAGITKLKSEDFQGLSNLEMLDLRQNELTALPDGVFHNLFRLEWLSLAGNDLSELPSGGFGGLANLKTLYLDSNEFGELPDGAFDGLTSLEYLDLGFSLSALPSGGFGGLANLNTLKLRGNEFGELPDGAFDGLTSLEYLDLGGSLSALPSGGFDGLANLKILYLDSNEFGELPDGAFDGLTSLEELFLYRNQLDVLPNGAFDELRNLKDLDLSLNDLSALPDGVFDNLALLRSLNLNNNDLNALPDSVFDDLLNLRGLNLNSNGLEELPDGVLDNLPCLLDLRLKDNLLQSLPDSLFVRTGLHCLLSKFWMYMDLRDNLLQSLPDGLFAGLNWSMTLGLEGNPGHPFTFIVELEARGNGAAVVRVAQSAPEDMYVTLSAQGGRLSVTEVRINRGTTISEPINVLYDGDGPVTITLEEARILNSIVHFRGDPFQTSLGGPLAMQYVEGTNTPATGAPTISGRSHVGETLKASITGISDVDGLSGASFGFQWVSNDGGSDTDIRGASDATYTVAGADEGRTIKVRVTWIDDAGYYEKLTSTVTAPVTVDTSAGICNRTKQVRDWIVGKIVGVSDCTEVTDSDLSLVGGNLYLGNSGIVRLQPVDLRGLSNLDLLGLARNDLDELPVDVFDDLSSLTILDLTGNGLDELPDGVFDELSSLTILDLTGNGLDELPDGVFDELSSLRVLELNRNKLTALPDGVFDNLSRLEWLSLFHNDLRELPDGVFDNLSQLEKLYLSNNGLSELPDGVFDNLSRLEKLSLHENGLRELPDGVFDNLSRLEWLSLSYNGLRELPDGVFDNLSRLEKLTLSNNGLSELPDGVFDNLSRLEELYLHDNDLNELPDAVFRGLTKLQTLGLTDNPGSPFTFTAELEQHDGGAVVAKVGQSAPFDMAVTLSAHGGTLPTATVAIDAGSTTSEEFSVTPVGNGPVTISVVSVTFLPGPNAAYEDSGVQTAPGEPLILKEGEGSNRAATGLPTVTGTAQVGQTLTADTSGIVDADGLTNAVFSYQWMADDTNIQDATGSNYTLVSDDEGKAITVTVSFTDTEGNPETLTSDPTGEVAPESGPLTTFTVVDTSTDPDKTLGTLEDGGALTLEDPASGSYGIRVDTDSNHDDHDDVHKVVLALSGAKNVNKSEWEPPYSLYGDSGAGNLDGGNLPVGSYDLKATAYKNNGDVLGTLKVSFSVEAQQPTVVPNTSATGVPTISGTVQVGETLTAETSGIADEDGLTNVVFSYQWMADDTAIQDATGSSYTLTGDDAGKAITVTVSFTDDANNEESLTSEPTGPVAPDPGPLTVFKVVDTSSNPDTVLGTLEDGGSLKLSNPASGSYGIRVDTDSGHDDHGDIHKVELDLTGAKTRNKEEGVFPYSLYGDEGEGNLTGENLPAGAYELKATAYDDDGDVLGTLKVSFTVTAGQPAQQPTVVPNTSATGVPTISGTVQVGETLTAETSGIADEDGLDNVTFSYQWMADDTNIQDATGSSYTLTEDDEGKAITVRVSFTDDANNEESLTSDPTGEVEAKPNIQATGLPTISGTAQVGQTLTADTTGIADADGLTAVSYSYQWMADDTNIQGATDATYTLAEDDEGKAIKVLVSFADDAGNMESRPSAPTDAVAAPPAQNSSATGAPSISGTAQVGQTLTADTSGIDDEDGLTNVVFSYQWMADDTNIQGATDATYTLAEDDEGKAIKVTVSFTDAEGNPETLTSDPTGEVAAKPNTQATGQPTISGTAQVGETLTADTSGIADEDGLDNVVFSYQWLADDTDIQGATGSGYTLTEDDEGKAITVTVSFTDAEGNPETLTSDATGEVAAKPNTQATGQPTISGTAQVGQTLTADTSGIDDEDGLNQVVFSYQWIRNDGNADEDITGATGSSYTLTEDDEGKTVKVTVSFTDAEGNPETLTSDPTGEVESQAGPLTGFTVVDAADTGQAVLWKHQTDGSKPEEGDTWKEWTDGTTLALGDPQSGRYGIRADTESGEGIHRVALELTLESTGEKKVDRTDDAAPYSLYGDEGEDALHGESLPIGSYTLKATAYTEDGEILGSLEISFTVGLAKPGRPQTLEGKASAQRIELAWKAPSGSVVTHYVIYRAELQNGQLNGRPMTKYATIDAAGKAMTYTDDNVEEGVEYRYRVAAVNSAGEGKKSNWLDI